MKAWLGALALSTMACAGNAATVTATLESDSLTCIHTSGGANLSCLGRVVVSYDFNGAAFSDVANGSAAIFDNATGTQLAAFQIHWQQDDVDGEGNPICYLICSSLSVGADGRLTALSWQRFTDVEENGEGGLDGIEIEFGFAGSDGYRAIGAWERITYDGLPAPVPLPATVGLLMAGLGALGLVRRRAGRAAGP